MTPDFRKPDLIRVSDILWDISPELKKGMQVSARMLLLDV